MEFKCFLFLVTLVAGQSSNDNETIRAVDNVFLNNSRGRIIDPFTELEEVTKKGDESIGALEKCGEGKDEGVHACVVYHMCDGKTNKIVQSGVTDGFGIIDIRFGENACSHPLDVCCGIPEGGLDPNLPQPGDPVTPSTTTTTTTTSGSGTGTLPETPDPIRSYCGIRNPNGIDFKITGNRENEADYGEFPWIVAILDNNYTPGNPDKRLLLCGGSLLTPNVVLTAAHCVYQTKTKDIRVRAGEWDTQTTRERLPYQERNVINIIVHEKFNPNTVPNDFALLVLDTPIDKADNVGTICLPPQNQKIESRNCFVSGWGKDVFGREGRYQAILKKIELPIIPRQQCQSALRKTRLGGKFQLHDSFMCAGGEVGKDACTGDGGSPLVCPDPLDPKRYVQAGIVAWGIGCGEANIPGVYADVAKFRNWIDVNMERLNIDTAPYNL